MNRYLIGCAAAVVISSLGTACGADESGSAYCTSFADAESTFRALETGDLGEFGPALTTFHALAAKAPPELEDEWGTLDGAFVSLEGGLAEAGLSVEELDKITTGNLPKDVDLSKLDQVLSSMEAFSSQDFSTAADTIEEHGQAQCGVDLSQS